MTTATKYGLLNAGIGLLVGIVVSVISTGEGYELLIVAAPLAGFITGWVAWLVVLPASRSIRAGRVIVTGILTGAVSHYVCWMMLDMILWLCNALTGGCTGSLGDAPASPGDMLLGAFGFSFFSLLFFGWFTVSAAIVSGIVLMKCGSSPDAS